MAMPPSIGRQEAEAVAQSGAADRFDRFVRLAQAVFGTPITALNLVGNDSQFTVSSIGFPKGEIPVEDSVCQVTVLQDDVLEVHDLREDERFSEIPAVTGGPKVRYYAGVPVRGQSGTNIGALCILDLAPRKLGRQQLQLLADLGALLEYELTVQKEMDLVGKVQQLMLPSEAPDIAGVEIAGRCKPAREAGGDYFDWVVVDDDDGGQALQVVLGDVMGKGLAASLFASEVRAVMRGHARFHDIGEAVKRTFTATGRDFEANDRFSTLWVGRLEPKTGTLEYVDAGHGLAIIVSKDNYRRLEQEYLPLGLPVDDTWAHATEFLREDELLIVTSDGLFDVVDDSFGELEARFRLLHDADMSCQQIVDSLVSFAVGQGATDDVTVLAIRRTAAETDTAEPDAPSQDSGPATS